MGCYFNPANTTPFFSSVKSHPSFFFFDGYACSYYTAQAVPAALSFSNYYEQIDISRTPTIIELADELDFYSCFLTNQPKAITIDIITRLTSAKEALIKNVNRSWHEGDEFISFDKRLISVTEEKIQQVPTGKNALFVLQLFGSHYPFEKRIPKDFRRPFQYTFQQEKETPTEAKNMADYLASISYTDEVLKEFFAMLHKKFGDTVPYSVIYFSDHGENPNYTRGDRHPSLLWLRIPYVIFLSQAYQKRYPATAEILRINTKYPVTNDLTANIFTALSHITFKNHILPDKYNLASPHYGIRLEQVPVNEGKMKLLDVIRSNSKKSQE